LSESGKSDTLQSKTLTVQVVSNPNWYAVLALPYLMEFPYECTEQTFNRLYANALARYIATSDPKIRKVFDQWKGTPALDSPLEKKAGRAGGVGGGAPGGEGGEEGARAPRQRRHPVRRQPPQPGDRPAAEAAGRPAAGRRRLAVVPRRPGQRLHHPVHHHRLRPPAPARRQDRRSSGHQVADAVGRLGRPAVPRHPQAWEEGRQPPVADHRPVPVR